MGERFLLEAAEDGGKGVGIEKGELGSLYSTDSRSAARQLAGFWREIAVDLAAVFEREMRGKGEESEGKWGASSRAIGVPGGVGEKEDVGAGFSARWFPVEEETDGEDDADRWGPPVSGKK
jgi:hypothetical protein